MTFHGSTGVERLKTGWLAVNRTSEGSDWECELPPIGEGRRISLLQADLESVGLCLHCRPLPILRSILHQESPEQASITRAPERHRAHLAARLPRKGPSAFLV
jgi:hypothetical protein